MSMVGLDPAGVAHRLENLGFLASSGLAASTPGYLLVALRPTPSLRHYDPEVVDYWVTDGQRGARRTLNRRAHLPLLTEVSWGPVRIVDRLGNANEYLTFGGKLSANLVDELLVAVLTCDTPLFKAGGHSQEVDLGAESVGAFFGRILRAIDYVPGFEARISAAEPGARYAAFLWDALARFEASPGLRAAEPAVLTALEGAERRTRTICPGHWRAGQQLWESTLAAVAPVGIGQPRRPRGDTQD
jgi:hypothetical protein